MSLAGQVKHANTNLASERHSNSEYNNKEKNINEKLD